MSQHQSRSSRVAAILSFGTAFGSMTKQLVNSSDLNWSRVKRAATLNLNVYRIERHYSSLNSGALYASTVAGRAGLESPSGLISFLHRVTRVERHIRNEDEAQKLEETSQGAWPHV